METKANYIIVGAFTLILLMGLVSAVVWLADIELDEEFAYYDLLFEGSVTGLKTGNPVRYRGVPVGVVTDMKINPKNVEQVKVTIEVPNETPIKEDTVASLEFQGITGIAYVQITGGTHDAPRLRRIPGRGNPVIKSKASQLQEVIDAAPELINRVISLVDRANLLLGNANQENFAAAMSNIKEISGSFAEGSDDIRSLLSGGAEAISELKIASAEVRLLVQNLRGTVDTLSDQAKGTLGDVRSNVNLITDDARATIGEISSLTKTMSGTMTDIGPQTKATLAAVKEAADSLDRSQDQLTELLAENQEPISNFTNSGLYEFTQLMTEIRTLVTALSRISGQIERDPARFLFGNAQQGVGVR
ncbi:MAG: MCE family protein [Alphaproteobacteria bacterium]|nr:MCE family protein [Alphaproteobacteria bacterium]